MTLKGGEKLFTIMISWVCLKVDRLGRSAVVKHAAFFVLPIYLSLTEVRTESFGR